MHIKCKPETLGDNWSEGEKTPVMAEKGQKITKKISHNKPPISPNPL